MIISKDLFIFGEQIFATIIPEVGTSSTHPSTTQQISQQQQGALVGTTVSTLSSEKAVEPIKSVTVEHTISTAAKALNKQETVAVVIAAAAAAAAAAASVSTSTKQYNNNNNNNNNNTKITNNNNTKIANVRKEADQEQETREHKKKQPQQQQQQNKPTNNGSTKTAKSTNKEETGSKGKKTAFKSAQQKANEESYKLMPEKELDAEEKEFEEEDLEEVPGIHIVEQKPLVKRNFFKLTATVPQVSTATTTKVLHNKKQELLQRTDCRIKLQDDNCNIAPLSSTTATKSLIPASPQQVSNLNCEDLSLYMGKVMLGNSTRLVT